MRQHAPMGHGAITAYHGRQTRHGEGDLCVILHVGEQRHRGHCGRMRQPDRRGGLSGCSLMQLIHESLLLPHSIGLLQQSSGHCAIGTQLLRRGAVTLSLMVESRSLSGVCASWESTQGINARCAGVCELKWGPMRPQRTHDMLRMMLATCVFSS